MTEYRGAMLIAMTAARRCTWSWWRPIDVMNDATSSLAPDGSEAQPAARQPVATVPGDGIYSISGPMVAGLACGLVVGTALGLLLAPSDGRSTRHWITVHGREAGRRAVARLHGPEVVALIRERGVLGLVGALRRRHPRES
jgi:hypothetical protein